MSDKIDLVNIDFKSIKNIVSFDDAKAMKSLLEENPAFIHRINTNPLVKTWKTPGEYSILGFVAKSEALSCWEYLSGAVMAHESYRYANDRLGNKDLLIKYCVNYTMNECQFINNDECERWIRAGARMGWKVQDINSVENGWERNLLDRVVNASNGENTCIIEMLIKCELLSYNAALKIMDVRSKESKISWSDITDREYIEYLEHKAEHEKLSEQYARSETKRMVQCL